uniref:ascorbate ferrireductase (transmembrane) n=1 Tax=Acrobeloides nanus TaxID=290746 RepID=A0A914CJE8_9BILA
MGAAIWFQVHRFLNLFAFCCITVVFFLIYWGHGWRVITCSETCTLHEYEVQVHAILGTVTYAFLILQVLMGMLRPGLDSPIRWYFNFIHKLNGMLIWAGATLTMFLGLEMGKTGLTLFYHGWPYFIMAVVLMVFILVWFICERIVFPWKFVPKVNENDEKRSNEEKLKQQKINLSKSLPLILILVHWLVGIAGAAALGTMLVNAMRRYGFDV